MNRTLEEEREPDLVYAVSFGFILALGLPLNAVSLWILLHHHNLKSPSAVFMVNLAVSDMLLVISLPMRVYFHATGIWPLSSAVCRFVTMLYRDNIRSSSIFITYISVDRLLAVVFPLRSRHRRTSSNAWKAAAIAWLVVLAMNIPEAIHPSKQSTNDTVPTCFQYRAPENLTRSITVELQAVLVVTMLAVNIVCTTMVFWTLCNRLSDSAKVNNKVNVMLIFAMNLVMFTICFVPLYIGVLTLKNTDLRPLVCLATVNCCLDPLLYYFSFDGFWKKKEDADQAREL